MNIPSQKELKELTSGERIYPGYIYEHTRRDHESRYIFAQRYITKHDRVLDAACGSGYGSALLAKSAAAVTGVDISEHAINFAQKNFAQAAVDFQVADLSKRTNFADGSFDRIVSFETFEHLSEPEALLEEFRRLLRPGGLLIISTPDKHLIQQVDPNNKFHLREFTKEEFVAALSKFFTIKEFFGQSPFQTLNFSQRSIKFVVKFLILIDVFRLRRILIPQRFKAPIVSSMQPKANLEEVYPVDIGEPNEVYVHLMAVCKRE